MWIPLFLNEQPISAMIDSAATPSCFKLSSNLFSLTTTSCKGSGILVANGQNLITLFFDTLSIRCGSPQFEMLLRF